MLLKVIVHLCLSLIQVILVSLRNQHYRSFKMRWGRWSMILIRCVTSGRSHRSDVIVLFTGDIEEDQFTNISFE